ncbi:hypothetical protein [Streptomyces sp. NPDC048106]|uniref:hypothetical protein n=1 Tax=Streptomyces sp. NPDC048106 TaxID=3155750 RepID=UPI0034531060
MLITEAVRQMSLAVGERELKAVRHCPPVHYQLPPDHLPHVPAVASCGVRGDP